STIAIIPFCVFTTPLRTTCEITRQRGPVIHAGLPPPADCALTGLTNGSRFGRLLVATGLGAGAAAGFSATGFCSCLTAGFAGIGFAAVFAGVDFTGAFAAGFEAAGAGLAATGAGLAATGAALVAAADDFAGAADFCTVCDAGALGAGAFGAGFACAAASPLTTVSIRIWLINFCISLPLTSCP